MEQVTVEEARARLAELIAAAQHGEPVYITSADQQTVQLVPIHLPVQPPRYLEFGSAPTGLRLSDDPHPQPSQRQPKFGNAAGTGGMADDFDAPLL